MQPSSWTLVGRKKKGGRSIAHIQHNANIDVAVRLTLVLGEPMFSCIRSWPFIIQIPVDLDVISCRSYAWLTLKIFGPFRLLFCRSEKNNGWYLSFALSAHIFSSSFNLPYFPLWLFRWFPNPFALPLSDMGISCRSSCKDRAAMRAFWFRSCAGPLSLMS